LFSIFIILFHVFGFFFVCFCYVYFLYFRIQIYVGMTELERRCFPALLISLLYFNAPLLLTWPAALKHIQMFSLIHVIIHAFIHLCNHLCNHSCNHSFMQSFMQSFV
jgi:hypothetical protein